MVRKPRLIGETQVFCIVPCWETGGRLVLADEDVEASHSTIFESFTVKRIETVAINSTINTGRNGNSRRTCSNDEHVPRTMACLESRDLEVDS